MMSHQVLVFLAKSFEGTDLFVGTDLLAYGLPKDESSTFYLLAYGSPNDELFYALHRVVLCAAIGGMAGRTDPAKCKQHTRHVLTQVKCAAVCCSVLQCVAVCCSVLQCVAVCCIAQVTQHLN